MSFFELRYGYDSQLDRSGIYYLATVEAENADHASALALQILGRPDSFTVREWDYSDKQIVDVSSCVLFEHQTSHKSSELSVVYDRDGKPVKSCEHYFHCLPHPVLVAGASRVDPGSHKAVTAQSVRTRVKARFADPSTGISYLF